MQLALEAIPISALKAGPNKIIEKLAQQPLLLTQNGRSMAVLVSPEDWNRREKLLAERRFTEAEIRAIALAYQRMAEPRDMVDGEEQKQRWQKNMAMLRIKYNREVSNYFLDNGELTFDLHVAIESLVFTGGAPVVGNHYITPEGAVAPQNTVE